MFQFYTTRVVYTLKIQLNFYLQFKNENYQLPSQRTKESMGGEDNMIKARQENNQAIKEENVDCSYLPRPAICEVGSTYVDPITGKELPKY